MNEQDEYEVCTQPIEELQNSSEVRERFERVQVGVLECCGRSVPLLQGQTVIGRDKKSGIVLDDPDGSISRRHAIINLSANKVFITDLCSLNGTYLDQEKIEPHVRYHVGENSELKIGTVVVKIKKFQPAPEESKAEDNHDEIPENTPPEVCDRNNESDASTEFDEDEVLDSSLIEQDYVTRKNIPKSGINTAPASEVSSKEVKNEKRLGKLSFADETQDPGDNSIFSIETQADLSYQIDALETTQPSRFFITPTQKLEEDNVVGMKLPESNVSPFKTPRMIKKTKRTNLHFSPATTQPDNDKSFSRSILYMETQETDENILNVSTQQNISFEENSSHDATQENILNVSTQQNISLEENSLHDATQENILNVSTQQNISLEENSSHDATQEIFLNVSTQQNISLEENSSHDATQENVWDMPTQDEAVNFSLQSSKPSYKLDSGVSVLRETKAVENQDQSQDSTNSSNRDDSHIANCSKHPPSIGKRVGDVLCDPMVLVSLFNSSSVASDDEDIDNIEFKIQPSNPAATNSSCGKAKPSKLDSGVSVLRETKAVENQDQSQDSTNSSNRDDSHIANCSKHPPSIGKRVGDVLCDPMVLVSLFNSSSVASDDEDIDNIEFKIQPSNPAATNSSCGKAKPSKLDSGVSVLRETKAVENQDQSQDSTNSSNRDDSHIANCSKHPPSIGKRVGDVLCDPMVLVSLFNSSSVASDDEDIDNIEFKIQPSNPAATNSSCGKAKPSKLDSGVSVLRETKAVENQDQSQDSTNSSNRDDSHIANCSKHPPSIGKRVGDVLCDPMVLVSLFNSSSVASDDEDIDNIEFKIQPSNPAATNLSCGKAKPSIGADVETNRGDTSDGKLSKVISESVESQDSTISSYSDSSTKKGGSSGYTADMSEQVSGKGSSGSLESQESIKSSDSNAKPLSQSDTDSDKFNCGKPSSGADFETNSNDVLVKVNLSKHGSGSVESQDDDDPEILVPDTPSSDSALDLAETIQISPHGVIPESEESEDEVAEDDVGSNLVEASPSNHLDQSKKEISQKINKQGQLENMSQVETQLAPYHLEQERRTPELSETQSDISQKSADDNDEESPSIMQDHLENMSQMETQLAPYHLDQERQTPELSESQSDAPSSVSEPTSEVRNVEENVDDMETQLAPQFLPKTETLKKTKASTSNQTETGSKSAVAAKLAQAKSTKRSVKNTKQKSSTKQEILDDDSESIDTKKPKKTAKPRQSRTRQRSAAKPGTAERVASSRQMPQRQAKTQHSFIKSPSATSPTPDSKRKISPSEDLPNKKSKPSNKLTLVLVKDSTGTFHTKTTNMTERGARNVSVERSPSPGPSTKRPSRVRRPSLKSSSELVIDSDSESIKSRLRSVSRETTPSPRKRKPSQADGVAKKTPQLFSGRNPATKESQDVKVPDKHVLRKKLPENDTKIGTQHASRQRTTPDLCGKKTGKSREKSPSQSEVSFDSSVDSTDKRVTRSKLMVLQSGGSGETDDEIRTIVKKLGGCNSEVVHKEKYCILVIKPPYVRTLKVLAMLARGLPIVTQNWVYSSEKAGKFVDVSAYILHDRDFSKKYNVNIKECLEKRQSGNPVFQGWTIMATPSTKPSGSDLQGVVESAGAVFIFQKPKVWQNPSLVISCKEDHELWPQFLGKSKKTYKPKLVEVNAVWESIQQQEVITEGYECID